MPLLAGFLGSAIGSLAAFFAKYLTEKIALGLAAFLAWMAVLAVFVGSVLLCLNSLYAVAGNGGSGGSGGDWVRYFWMGLGMFIPSNAGAVMTCLGSVWVGTEVYKVRRTGIQVFGKP